MPDTGTDFADLQSPAEHIDTGRPERGPEAGIALCLSGGGYRAMLFHVGSLWRLHETGILAKLDRISSVSGGSITAATLGLALARLATGGNQALDFGKDVVAPIIAMAGHTIDVGSILGGIFLPGSVSRKIEKAYTKHLYRAKTLQDLPDRPRFVINATNVQSGALWRFMKPYMRDYRVGEVRNPTVSLAFAVAASSAFPPVLSPAVLKLDNAAYTPDSGKDLQFPPYTTTVVLSDGGVYDNLGLETAWKRYKTVLVSDAGGKMQPEAAPKRDWARHSLRVFGVVDNQVRSLRKRQLIGSYKVTGPGHRDGAYWGIRTDVKNYGLPDPLPCPDEKTLALAETPTRLAKLPMLQRQRLVNWGYAVCDAAIRKHYDPALAPPAGFPYPDAGVG
jgi:NTE family protein